MRTINEGSAYSTIVYFTTDEEPVTPTTVHYSHRNENTNTTLLDITSIGTGEEVTITIPATANSIERVSNAYEIHLITIYTDYGTDAQQTAEERYRVRNLGGVGDPVEGDSDYGD